MAREFTMPKLGLTMEAGTIVEWLVADGEEVDAGTAVLLIETDKVETEVEASGSGLLHQVGVVGETYDCGVGIGWFLAEGEQPPAPAPVVRPDVAHSAVASSAPRPVQPAPATGGRLLASPNARRVAAARGIDLRLVRGTGPGGRIVSEDVEETAAGGPASAPGPSRVVTAVPATAAARQLADLLGVDLAAVASVDGRCTREDVARHVREVLARAVPAGAAPPTLLAPPSQTPVSTTPLRGMRGTIASRMHASLHQMAQLTLTMDVDMDAVVADRENRRQSGAEVVPGYTDYVIAATAQALVEHPMVNSQIIDEGVALLPDVHVGLAVALDDGLVVPVIRDTPGWSIAELATETTRLAEAARSGALTLDELEGGTFSVTALGMFGVDAFTPIINPPNTAILGVGRIRQDVALDDGGQPVARHRLTLSLTWDHRAFDGAPAALFVRAIKQHLDTDWA